MRSKRNVLVVASAIILFVVAIIAMTEAAPAKTEVHTGAMPQTATPSPPNIVLITVDDMRADELRYMPNVRQLIGGEGFTFQRAYSTYPLCCPARTSMITGQYAHNHGVLGNVIEQHGGYVWFKRHAEPKNTLGVWMQKRGYHTSLIGKFLNRYGEGPGGRTEVPPGWTMWAGIPGMQAYRFYNQPFNINGHIKRFKQHNTRVVTDLSIEQMRVGAPFFTWVSYLAPHDKYEGDGQWSPPVPQYADRTKPVGPSNLVLDQDRSDKPSFMRRLPKLNRAALTKAERLRVARARSLMGVDRSVGRIIRHLEREQLLDTTLIIFNSDNGYTLGEQHVIEGKTMPYEKVTRVPVLMRGPGVPEGRTKSFVALHDIASTIIDVSGAQPGRVFDGRSLLRTARQPDRFRNRPMLYESGNVLGTLKPIAVTQVGKRFFTAIHSGNWVYIDYVTGEEELYNLVRDPHQLHSLHRDPRYRSIKEQLERKLRSLRDCRGRECNTSFQLVKR